MGCAQSKIEIENKESVCRCKDSLHFLKEAVTARIAFASALSGYAMALKNIGSALCDYYAQEEAEVVYHTPPPSPSSPLQPPPPPPPLPKRFLKKDEENDLRLRNGAILEEDEEEENDLRLRKGRKSGGIMAPPPPLTLNSWDYFFKNDNMLRTNLSEREDREHDLRLRKGRKSGGRMATVDETPSPMAPPPLPKSKGMSWDYFFNTDNMPQTNLSEEEDDDDDYIDEEEEEEEEEEESHHLRQVESKTPESVDLLMILRRIEDYFVRASKGAHEASIATALNYHSKFADNRGQIDHAAKVTPNGENGKDDYAEEKAETHVTVLDKLLACEKNLLEEVKAGELMKLEYRRKVVLLNKLKKSGVSNKSLEKTKAVVSHLHARYIVDMQSLDSTVSEVNDIRGKQLYPKLVAFVDGMSNMWDSMCKHHDNQLTIFSNLKSLDVSGAPKETTKHHYEMTAQLYLVVQGWHSHFETLVTHQKHYVEALNNWLKVNLIPIESSLKEKISSPPRTRTPSIQTLLHSWRWHDHLQKLPDELAKSAFSSFAAVIKTIMNHQEEEMKLKDKWVETRRKYWRKSNAFEDWYNKYIMRRGPQEETGVTGTDPKDPIAERQVVVEPLKKRLVVEPLKKRLEDEMEAHQKLCVQVRDKSLGSLKIQLPELVRAMSDYAHVCRDSSQVLRLIMHSLPES